MRLRNKALFDILDLCEQRLPPETAWKEQAAEDATERLAKIETIAREALKDHPVYIHRQENGRAAQERLLEGDTAGEHQRNDRLGLRAETSGRRRVSPAA